MSIDRRWPCPTWCDHHDLDKDDGTTFIIHRSKNLLIPEDDGAVLFVELWEREGALLCTTDLDDEQRDPQAAAEIGAGYTEAGRLMSETRASFDGLEPIPTLEDLRKRGVA